MDDDIMDFFLDCIFGNHALTLTGNMAASTNATYAAKAGMDFPSQKKKKQLLHTHVMGSLSFRFLGGKREEQTNRNDITAIACITDDTIRVKTVDNDGYNNVFNIIINTSFILFDFINW